MVRLSTMYIEVVQIWELRKQTLWTKRKSPKLQKKVPYELYVAQALIFYFSLYFLVHSNYALEFNRDIIDLCEDLDKPIDLEDFGDGLDLGDDVEDGFFLLFLLLVWILDKPTGIGGTSLVLSDIVSWLEPSSKSVI